MCKTPVIDLFAGPGGLGEGFSSLLDKNGNSIFEISLSIEKQYDAHQTLELRSFFRKFPKKNLPEEYYQYLRGEIKDKDILFSLYPIEAEMAKKEAWRAELGGDKDLNDRIDNKIEQIKAKNDDCWVLIGGPPCQAYSVIGRSRNKGKKDYIPEKDSKSFLYKEYLRIIAKHKPAFFVMENVKGMLSYKLNGQSVFEKIINDLKCPTKSIKFSSLGKQIKGDEYEIFPFVSPQNYNAGDRKLSDPKKFIIKSENYGIPQARHRVVLFGIRKKYSKVNPPALKENKKTVCVKDVLMGLPKLRSGLSREKDSLAKWKTRVLKLGTNKWFQKVKNKNKVYRNLLNTLEKLKYSNFDVGGQFVKNEMRMRSDLNWWYIDKKLKGACNHRSKSHMTADLHRYLYSACFSECTGTSPRIEDFPNALIPKHKNAKSGHFNDRFRVQLSNMPSTTITSHIAKDGHYFIHYDPLQCRSLTVREAARLQTFPDNYFFEGSRTQQYTQVGNAVPPLLARQIAKIVNDAIKNSKLYD